MWLVKLRRASHRIGSPVPPENSLALDKTITIKGQFTASGRRGGFDCYLFINRSEAETFKQRVGPRKASTLRYGRSPRPVWLKFPQRMSRIWI